MSSNAVITGARSVSANETVVQSVQRAARVLRAFSRQRPELGVTELSRDLGMHKSTVSRLLAALRQEGLVTQVPDTGKYRLGVGVVALAGVALETLDIVAAAEADAHALADTTHETVSVVVREGVNCVDLLVIPGSHPVRAVRALGQRIPLHLSAGGQVLLAFGDQVPAGTELANVRHDGYAEVRDGWGADLVELAVPVRDSRSRVAAALSVTVPAYRAEDNTLAEILATARAAALRISANLGFEHGVIERTTTT